MNQDLIMQAIQIFDTYDKWDAFIVLSNNIPEIRRRYFERLKSDLTKHFSKDIAESWSFVAIHNEQYRWYLSEFGYESLGLLWRANDFLLWCNPDKIDANKVRDLLNTPDFNIIFNCFDNIDSLSNPLHHFVQEKHRYTFRDSTSYSAPDEDDYNKLAWFAGNKTDELIELIAIKINKFRTIEITTLIKDLIVKCKKL